MHNTTACSAAAQSGAPTKGVMTSKTSMEMVATTLLRREIAR